MALHDIKYFDDELEYKLLKYQFDGRSISELDKAGKYFYRSVQILREFMETGEIRATPILARKEPLVYSGSIGLLMLKFIEHKEMGVRLSTNRISCYKRNLHTFLLYCQQKSITSIKDVGLADILQFLRNPNSKKCNDICKLISTLRVFFKYLHSERILDLDYSAKIPRYKRIAQPQIPSVYSIDEIEKLLSSISRSSNLGKRNYAIILLMVRLGIRALDVCRLKFEHIHWNTSTIEFEQCKTGKAIVLPLLPEVGNAIIDYLRYGRPESKESYVFLMEKPPFCHFATSGVVTHIVQRAYQRSGVNIEGKRYGAHSLRHSLSSRMLKEGIILPVISEVLGHHSTESTRYYLRIDLSSLKHCILEVPPVSSSFYQQKGGVFYE